MAMLYLIAAAFIIQMIGVEKTSYIAVLVFAAAVLAGGTYGIIMIAWLIASIIRRVANRQPIMEIED